ncbi:jupiter microtubule associated homolog 1-like isoform X1 [Danaus plexippus]|uniref:Uncharacterized protein n=2 Tax=Danaus plexippus TaxID=13037 RepID=A0A212FCX4_DANPL|nr:jupiter microtubule associated homolog 1-like isoform X1 [Danaus plexippus]OWR51548.1 hypothetical protein KGM_209029 [Danaus plexippus plexippus]
MANRSNMTSTSFNVGLNDGVRSSSRVLRPPGGGHTDIFGGEPEPPRGRRPAPALVDHIQHGQGDEPARPTNGATTPNQNGQANAPVQPSPVEAQPSPVEAKPVEAKPVEAVEKSASPKAVTPTEPKVDAPKRVRVPPGGFSSGLW